MSVQTKTIDLETHEDPALRWATEAITLGDLLLLVARLMGTHGKAALLRLDAGHNNVSAYLDVQVEVEDPPKPAVPFVLEKPGSYATSATPDVWFVSEHRMADLTQLAKTARPILHLYAGRGTHRCKHYELEYDEAPFTLVEDDPLAIDGRPYYRLDLNAITKGYRKCC